MVIKFSDNGIGMDKKVLEKMFEPFFTTKKSGIGSGLGLSITKDIIVNKHNGFIECTSKKGIGTVFEIRLLKWKN